MAWLFSDGKQKKYDRGVLIIHRIHRWMPPPGSLGHLEPVTLSAPQCQTLLEAVLSSFSDEQNYFLRDSEAKVFFSFSLE